MTDYLLVHGAGQGAWSWGAVWGYLTAPEDHPPTLHKRRRANRVHPIDLPGQGADAEGDTAAVRLEECVQAIIRAADREHLKDMVLVGQFLALFLWAIVFMLWALDLFGEFRAPGWERRPSPRLWQSGFRAIRHAASTSPTTLKGPGGSVATRHASTKAAM